MLRLTLCLHELSLVLVLGFRHLVRFRLKVLFSFMNLCECCFPDYSRMVLLSDHPLWLSLQQTLKLSGSHLKLFDLALHLLFHRLVALNDFLKKAHEPLLLFLKPGFYDGCHTLFHQVCELLLRYVDLLRCLPLQRLGLIICGACALYLVYCLHHLLL